MKNKITDSQVKEIIEILQGTCDTLSGAVSEVVGDELSDDDLTMEQLEAIDSEIFCCDECSWWCDISEMSECEDENKCTDCDE